MTEYVTGTFSGFTAYSGLSTHETCRWFLTSVSAQISSSEKKRTKTVTCWRKMWDNETVEPLLPPLLLLLSWLCDPLDPRRSKQSLVSPHWIIRGMHPCSESVCLRLHQWSVMQNVLLLLAQFLLHFFFFKIFYFPLCNMLIFWILMSLFLTYLQYVYLYHCYLCLSLHRRANNVFWTDGFTGLSLVVV